MTLARGLWRITFALVLVGRGDRRDAARSAGRRGYE